MVDMEKSNLTFPMVALRGLNVFPNITTNFDVGRKKSIQAINEAVDRDGYVFLVSQKDAMDDDVKPGDIYTVGTVAKIKQQLRLPGENIRILAQGLYRAEIQQYVKTDDYFEVSVTPIVSYTNEMTTVEAYLRMIKELISQFAKLDVKFSTEIIGAMTSQSDEDLFVNTVASTLLIKLEDRQAILEEIDVIKRLAKLYELLQHELEILKIEKKISAKVRGNIEKNQKEYYLREQIRVIQDELGDNADEITEFEEKIKALKMPNSDSEEKILKEIRRMAKMQPSSPEYTVMRNYIDWVVDLPWSVETKDNLSIEDARKILDEDHFGLEKVKERILEFLAVHTLTNSLKGPIICFVGPPGVGKTSIAKSIARALNRNFVRMSLGGVRDEAEIRGHRRTYIGSMPGRVLYSMKNARSINPVFLLDEIDKMSSDYKGDPASAMLEVLDPEQNNEFRDHYLEVPYDLSKVLFLTTANTLDGIPAALLDRMEIIEISGYVQEEKIEIAKRYLIPKKCKEHGLKETDVSISDDALAFLISAYTRESGVRNLEREIASLCRKAALRIAAEREKGEQTVVVFSKEQIEELLGAIKFRQDSISENDEVGAATGLAWTAVGGTTLTIEVSLVPGKGEIILTGKLGDVMKESARAALSLVKSKATVYGIAQEAFVENDIHIHVPEGAVPKDGPSAGITIATAILSAFIERPINRKVAMTGEITLRGKVLPIGGIKEKTLAAHRAGIQTVIIPKENKKDMEEIPESVKNELQFILVDDIASVFNSSILF